MKFACLFLLLIFTSVRADTYLVTNKLNDHDPSSKVFHIDSWSDLVSTTKDNDRIIFIPGYFFIKNQLMIENKNRLVIIGDGVTLDSQRSPLTPSLKVKCDKLDCIERDWSGESDWIADYVNMKGYSTFRILNSEHVKIKGFNIINSWPNSISIWGRSKYINMLDLNMLKGTNAIYAEGEQISNISITHSIWNQDPSEEIWSKRDWKHAHHGLYNFLNGAFFQARNIKGIITIRNNTIKNAFNGIRMKVTSDKCPEPRDCSLNTDVIIEKNNFYKIADNTIEPEYYANKWSVKYNRLRGVYAPFSFDGVYSNRFHIMYNLVEAMELPRMEVAKEELSDGYHQGSRLFKLNDGSDTRLKHFNFIVNSNIFNTYLTNAIKLQRFTDVDEITDDMVFKKNHICYETLFNRNKRDFAPEFTGNNSFIDCY